MPPPPKKLETTYWESTLYTQEYCTGLQTPWCILLKLQDFKKNILWATGKKSAHEGKKIKLSADFFDSNSLSQKKLPYYFKHSRKEMCTKDFIFSKTVSPIKHISFYQNTRT